MNTNEVLNKYNISNATLRNWKKLNLISDLNDIKQDEIDKILKKKVGTRRNKKISINKTIPVSYIEDKRIIKAIESILDLKDKYSLKNNQILHEAILKILNNNNLDIPDEIEKVLGKPSNNVKFKKEFENIEIVYENDNDFLGCLYMSLISIGKKDTDGIYYTPFKVVNQIITSIDFNATQKVIDPGCGSGNFLMQAFKQMKSQEISVDNIINNLYGFDIDKIAVLLSKINIYILDNTIDFKKINVYQKDFLNDKIDIKFDCVIGNPPWGKKYKLSEKEKLKKKYNLEFSRMDSFSQFIIRSFDIMNEKGTLAFVLPSSILNISVHEKIRKFLLDKKIIYIKKIGREFEEVVTDVIIIKVTKESGENNNCMYDDLLTPQSNFLENPYCNFLVKDSTSSSIIKKIKRYPSTHLVENVTYALGIVTGNNNDFLSREKNDKNEPIISGNELDKYNIDYSKIKNFIEFDKDKFQQVAQEESYRHKNKIIYKFIGKKLCFSVDTKSTLTLNSANIICLGNDYDLYYVSAILNSRITQLYFEDLYKTHKVLKNHIESFYIPRFPPNIKRSISEISKNLKPQSDYCNDIEEIIYRELELTNKEIEYLKNRF